MFSVCERQVANFAESRLQRALNNLDGNRADGGRKRRLRTAANNDHRPLDCLTVDALKQIGEVRPRAIGSVRRGDEKELGHRVNISSELRWITA
ncbi:MAG: hypothetical protein WBK99_02990 [Solirubrobacterales bacterium]